MCGGLIHRIKSPYQNFTKTINTSIGINWSKNFNYLTNINKWCIINVWKPEFPWFESPQKFYLEIINDLRRQKCPISSPAHHNRFWHLFTVQLSIIRSDLLMPGLTLKALFPGSSTKLVSSQFRIADDLTLNKVMDRLSKY